MRSTSTLAAAVLAAFGASLLAAPQPAHAQSEPRLAALHRRAAELTRDIELLEAQSEVEKLQRIYGFYTDKHLWSEAADLFAADGTIEVGGRGVYAGKDRVLEFLRSQGPELPQPGRLFDQMQLQPVVHVASDGASAKGRWHLFAQEAVHGEYGRWGAGVYENEYVKENGVWKIRSLHLYTTMYTPYEQGWGKAAIPNEGPLAELPPDRPPSVEYAAYPAAFVPPFHFQNPVTGAPVYQNEAQAEPVAPADAADLAQALQALDRRVTRLEDLTQLENLNSIYGYYLAHNEWDNFTGLFAPDGTIEIAMRGVYVGRPSVRRSMNLYGEAGSKHGLLHNHMQFQPVIHIAEDGASALMRSRAFSIMGEWQGYSMWMGGVYENTYVKRDGVWMLGVDRVFNTYFTPYTVSWKDAAPRPPPQVSATNPPDRPPSSPFEMYPSAFLPPFHYPNPVTGNAVVWPQETVENRR